MPRAVYPWEWRRILRDHGPESRDVLLTLYTIATFMDKNGYAFPAQSTIAKGARVSTRTAQRHIAAAIASGWLSVEIAGRTGCVFHLKPVASFTACRSAISRHVGRSFHAMPVALNE